MVTIVRTALSALFFMLITTGTARAILFSGNTNTSSPTTIDVFLVYAPASFSNINVPVGPGPTSLSNLGTFTLNVCGSINCEIDFGTQDGVTDFTLRITFTDPTVTGSPAVFTADIFGTIERSGNSDNIDNNSLLTINFDNTVKNFNYLNASGSGSFGISVNDPAAYTEASQFGDTRTITGQITNLTFTSSTEGGPAAAVPEPASIFLLGAGLVALRFGKRWLNSN